MLHKNKKQRFPNHSFYRDPLHGLIAFDRECEYDQLLMALIDTPEFQRLRRIRQLGLAFYAYHGAEHSRFTHSIGVTHLVGRVLAHLREGYEISADQLFLARCAALLHDIGHGPFSHVLESFFGDGHEEWTKAAILSPDSRVHQLLAAHDLLLPTLVVDLLSHHYQPRFLAHLIASQLDADRFDYLLRDSLMTGVKYGIYDLDRLIAMLDVDRTMDQLIVSDRGVFPVEQYLLARHQMFRQVYQHKTVIAAEAMLRALLERARQLARDGQLEAVDRNDFLFRILTAENAKALSLIDFLALDDTTLWHYIKVWSQARDATLSDLARRLLQRDLFKTISLEQRLDNWADRTEDVRELLRSEGCEPEYYLLITKAQDTPYKPYNPEDKNPTTSIFVRDVNSDAGYGDIVNRSSVVQALTHEKYSITHLVFPADHNGKPLRDRITKILIGSAGMS